MLQTDNKIWMKLCTEGLCTTQIKFIDALVNPGCRIQLSVPFSLPDFALRIKIWKSHVPGLSLVLIIVILLPGITFVCQSRTTQVDTVPKEKSSFIRIS